MAQRVRRLRNVHVILATAAGLVLLVSLALGGLGWRLLEQEQAIERQQARDALEGKANILQTRFFSRMAEVEAVLRGLGGTLSAGDGANLGSGTVLVALKNGVQVQPPGQLLYLPVAPQAPKLDESLFDEARRLEFQSRDLHAAGAALAALAANQPAVRAEALLHLARIQKNSGKVADALATYAKLSREKVVSPSLEAPYGLVGQIQRVKLLKESGDSTAAQQEADALIAGLIAGEWSIDKSAHEYYYADALELAGRPADTALQAEKVAIAEIVAALWDEWRQFGPSGSRSMTKVLHTSGPVPLMAVANANPDRLVAAIYAGEALRYWIPDPAASGETSGIRVDLIGPEGRPLLGGVLLPAPLRVARSLSNLPWRLDVSTSESVAAVAFASERRNYLILILVAIVLMVALACYALARGVLREAAVGQLQSDFVSAVSHEFRSPLTTLRQLTELLAEGRIHDEGRRLQYFGVLQKETSRLHHLVEDLLDFGRMDAGRRQYRLEAFDLTSLVRDSVERYQTEAGANGHTVEFTPGHGELPVEADREALQRVVRNLLENAVKYSPEADKVWVETDCDGRSAVLRVRDKGIGIPPEEKKRIFEKFVRGDAAKRAAIPGTGIGLAMVREIVRVHHGEVDVASEVGSGSTFIVRLPLSPNAGAAEVHQPQAIHGSAR